MLDGNYNTRNNKQKKEEKEKRNYKSITTLLIQKDKRNINT